MQLLFLVASGVLSGSLVLAPSPEPAPAGEGAWPLVPRPEIARGFDPPATAFGAGHRGVDLLGHAGQAVHTSLAGTVTFATTLAGRGVVVVDHGRVRTTYEPVSARVDVGEHVDGGAVIGSLQRAASHCFPRACLHWGLRRGDTYLDPLVLVGAGPVRLLPLDGGGDTTGIAGLGPTRAGRPVRPVSSGDGIGFPEPPRRRVPRAV